MIEIDSSEKFEFAANQKIGESPQTKLFKCLKTLLVDESLLYTKLRNYQWKLNFSHSYALQAILEAQCDGLLAMTDMIDDCFHQSPVNVFGTGSKFLRIPHLLETPDRYPNAADAMTSNLRNDHETIIRFLSADIKEIESDLGNTAAIHCLIEVLHQHEKMLWILRLYLEDEVRS